MKLVQQEAKVIILFKLGSQNWTQFTTVPESQAELKLKKLKTLFPNHQFTIKK